MNFPQIEKKILKFWEEKKIFEKSISQRKGKPFFSFYDGPPFATGKPHYGHILATTIKDTILRYWTMHGFQVPRRVGWDCHGLPVENLIEKELGIKNKREIEKFGIEKFNQACRAAVFRCVKDFEETLKRVGRWADYKKSYATLDTDYIESVWWVLKQLWQQGLVYKDYRVSPYCPRCGTPLSNFEVNLGYKEIKETSIYLKFKIKNSAFKNSFFLVWTTTPWTLPSNVALAVHAEAKYVLVKQNNNEKYILAKDRIGVLNGEYQIIKNFLGKNLVGLKYKALFDPLVKQKIENIENAFQVLPADFVTLEEGTGIVHIAPMYGDDDFQLGKKFNLSRHHLVDQAGFFKEETGKFAGQFVKNADSGIIEDLSERNLLYKKEEVLHSYPFCWRCDTPLLYYAFESWYISVTKFKKELVLNNKKIHWVPSHIKEGRFGKWLKDCRDWNFSRNRFWGAPLPIWECQNCKKAVCIGSLKELKKRRLNKSELKDLHRPFIDKISLKCEKCGGLMKRTEEVFDCWFESGSMPYSQWHYPFENKSFVEKTFPADFIAEGLDQTRGWFYTLHVLSAALTLTNLGLGKLKPAFKNVIVNGLILDTQGRKLSKKLGNYPEPSEIFDHYGADSLRYFLLASTPIGEDYRFSSKGVEEASNKIVATLWHSYMFFETYKDKDFQPNNNFEAINVLNKWIISKLQGLNQEAMQWMDQYEITKAARLFGGFIEDLSNWYIRRARRYFQKPENKNEKEEFCQVLYYVLITLSKLVAPFLPFLSEELYQNLKLERERESIHLCDFPKPKKHLINKRLEEKMKIAKEIVGLALAERAKAGIKVRQPLARLKIKSKRFKIDKELLELIKEEVNVKEVILDPKIKEEIKLDTKITHELKEEGIIREVIRNIQEMRKKIELKPWHRILIQFSGSQNINKILLKNRNFILKETKAENFTLGDKSKKIFDVEKEITVGQEKLWLAIKKI